VEYDAGQVLWVVFVVDDILYAPMSGRDADADWFRQLLNREYGIKDRRDEALAAGVHREDPQALPMGALQPRVDTSGERSEAQQRPLPQHTWL